MVLDTSGTSWNLLLGHEGPPRKHPYLADVSMFSPGKNAKISMRARLAGFAHDGVCVVRNKEDQDDPEEKEGAEDEVEPRFIVLENMSVCCSKMGSRS